MGPSDRSRPIPGASSFGGEICGVRPFGRCGRIQRSGFALSVGAEENPARRSPLLTKLVSEEVRYQGEVDSALSPRGQSSMRAYGLASVRGPGDQQWLNMSAAFARIDPIEHVVCIGSRSRDPTSERITEEACLARKEWTPEDQRDPTDSLSDIMRNVSKNSRYPLETEFVLKTTQSRMEEKRIAFENRTSSGGNKGGGGISEGEQE